MAEPCDLVEMHRCQRALTRATLTERARWCSFVSHGCPGSFCPRVRGPSRPGHDSRFGVGIHEATLRVNVRWVTPLGEETASTS
jgi:hypothetical protein